jgi:hypothetical protein
MIDPGLREAINIAVEIARLGVNNMFVTHSPDGEYSSSFDVVATKVKENGQTKGE